MNSVQLQSECSEGERLGLIIGQAYPAKKTMPRVCKKVGDSLVHHTMARFIFTPDLDLFVTQNIRITGNFALRQVGFVRYAFKL